MRLLAWICLLAGCLVVAQSYPSSDVQYVCSIGSNNCRRCPRGCTRFTVDKNIIGATKCETLLSVYCQNVDFFFNIVIAILDFYLLLRIKLWLFQLCDSKSCCSLFAFLCWFFRLVHCFFSELLPIWLLLFKLLQQQ